jgi:hypothetical protein
MYSELFEEILKKPALYVGDISIIRIKSFVDGYLHARWETGQKQEDDLYFGFQRFVERRLHLSTSHSWDRMICFMSSNDVEAFEMANDLWTEYKIEVSEQREGSSATGSEV